MPDITLCNNQDCPLSKKCYRHEDSGTKPSEYWQSYADFEYTEDGCEDFWPIDAKEKKDD